MNTAAALRGESEPATPGGQRCGDIHCGRPGLIRSSSWRFARSVLAQREARVRTTKRRAFGPSLRQKRRGRSDSAHSCGAAPGGERRHAVLTVLAQARPSKAKGLGEDFARQAAAFLFPSDHKRIEDSEQPFRLTTFRRLTLTWFGRDYGVHADSLWVRAQTDRSRRKTSCAGPVHQPSQNASRQVPTIGLVEDAMGSEAKQGSTQTTK